MFIQTMNVLITVIVLLISIRYTGCLLSKHSSIRFPIGRDIDGAAGSAAGVLQDKIRRNFTTRRMSHDSSYDSTKRQMQQELFTNNKNATMSNARGPLIKNFRKAAGLNRVYRCGNTDGLGGEAISITTAAADSDGVVSFLQGTSKEEQVQEMTLGSNHEDDSISTSIVLLCRAGLILDLRSDTERNETLAQAWMRKAPRGGIQVKHFTRNSSESYSIKDALSRCVYRIDLLSPKRLFDYMFNHWISSPFLKLQYRFNTLFDTAKLHEMRMDILNNKGIQGLYEAMLETSGNEFCAALKAMTIYLENNRSNKDDVIIVHCVQGKDRTGLVIMLCQAILGIADGDIVTDYHASEKMLLGNVKSNMTHDGRKVEKGKLNKSFFSGSPKAAMMSTLAFIRDKYGSIDSYLDFIGFDASWRQRFQNVMQEDDTYLYNGDIMKLLPTPLQSKL
jgi:hypothetical protein